MEDLLKNIVEKLIQKTKAKEVVWEKSPNCGFTVQLSNNKIVVDLCNSLLPYYYLLTVFSENKEISSYSGKEGGLLQELHQCARASYYNIEEVYKSILFELDSL
jgi:hypothetical protein